MLNRGFRSYRGKHGSISPVLFSSNAVQGQLQLVGGAHYFMALICIDSGTSALKLVKEQIKLQQFR